MRAANTPGGGAPLDIACMDGAIAAVEPRIEASAREEIDAHGLLVAPSFVDAHFHLDSALSYGRPRINESGTLLEGIGLWSELKTMQTKEEIIERATRMCHWSIARGVLAVRAHADVSGPSLDNVEALLEVREAMRPWLDIQLVAFPQDGYYRTRGADKLLARALDMGVDVVGGIPHYERTMAEGADSVRALCQIAVERGLMVDMHCDENDDPHSRHIETLAQETARLGLHGKVTGSHLTSMHSMDNSYVGKLLPLMAESGVAAVSNPLVNITLQGRHDTYPKRRGLTRIREMWEHGITVSLGHDCVMDPWYPLGSHDMLEVAMMGAHAGLLTAPAQMEKLFNAVTHGGARVMGLPRYGLATGCHADFVVLQAADPIEAMRLRATRLYVVRRGRIVSRQRPAICTLSLNGEQTSVDFARCCAKPGNRGNNEHPGR